jgi:hypothetical protein
MSEYINLWGVKHGGILILLFIVYELKYIFYFLIFAM